MTNDFIFRLSFVDEDFHLEVEGCQYVELSECSQNTQHFLEPEGMNRIQTSKTSMKDAAMQR